MCYDRKKSCETPRLSTPGALQCQDSRRPGRAWHKFPSSLQPCSSNQCCAQRKMGRVQCLDWEKNQKGSTPVFSKCPGVSSWMLCSCLSICPCAEGSAYSAVPHEHISTRCLFLFVVSPNVLPHSRVQRVGIQRRPRPPTHFTGGETEK